MLSKITVQFRDNENKTEYISKVYGSFCLPVPKRNLVAGNMEVTIQTMLLVKMENMLIHLPTESCLIIEDNN
jgi:hypothetical protein